MPEVVKTDAQQMAERSLRRSKQDIEDYRASLPADESNHHETSGRKTQVKTISIVPAAQKEIKRLKVAAYCRVSTDFDSQESSLESQQKHYESEIADNPEWEFAGVYLELGISGTKAEIRPELQRMIGDCKAGKIDLILTKSISRFSRNTQDCLEMVRTLTGLGVNLFFEKENIHTGTMDSELMLSLLACFAQDESRSISSNMKWGIRKRFQDGTYKASTAPYGYRWNDGKLEIVSKQAEIIKRIYQMALSGNGMTTIARKLNDEGIPAPRGKQWTQSTLKQIVRNPVYKGDMLYQKTYMDERYRERINYGELDQYYDEGHHIPIIDRESFEKVQALVERRARQNGYTEDGDRSRSTHQYCFSGILRCAECGDIMYRTAWNDRLISWICKRHKTGPELCGMKPQPEQDLKNAFLNCLNKLAFSQRSRNAADHVLDVYEAMLGKSESEKNKERLAEIEQEIEKTREEISKLMAIVMRERFLPEHREKKQILTNRMTELMTERSQILKAGEAGGTLQELKAFIAGWQITGNAADFPEKFFNTYVESCTVNSQQAVTFHFRCGLSLTETLYRSEVE